MTTNTAKTFCEFFAGIGLIHAALQQSGWRCIYANDNDPKKAAMYERHFSGSSHYHLEDVWATEAVVRKITETPFLATASFPCTDMSLAGKMQGFRGQESSAFFGFTAAIKQLGQRKPRIIMLENVVGFLTSRQGQDFRAAVGELAEMGYWVDALVLDAKKFVPQSRQRLFVIGYHQDSLPEQLIQQNPDDLFGDPWRRAIDASPALRPERLRQAMGKIEPATGWATVPLAAPAQKEYQLSDYLDLGDQQEWWDQPLVDKHYAMMSDAHRKRVDRLLADGQLSVATIYRRIRQGQQRAEVRFDGLAGCLRTPRGGSARQIVLLANRGRLQMRWMSPREYARLQGAEDYTIEVGANQALFGFGDAVCAPAIRWLDEQILTPAYEASLSCSVK